MPSMHADDIQPDMQASRHQRTVSRLASITPWWLLLAGSYWLAAKAGLALAFGNASASVVWAPTGIALAAVMVYGPRVWPGIFLGAFLANVTIAGSISASLLIAAGNTGEALLGAYLVNRFAGGRAAFQRERHIVMFVLGAGVVSPAVCATIGVSSLSWNGLAPWSEFASIWLTWWLGDAAGAVVVAPLLLLWYEHPRLTWSPAHRLELALLLMLLVAVAWLVFVVTSYPIGFLCLPMCIWAGARFGQREAATATVILSAIAIWGTLAGRGPFAAWPTNDALMLLQAFMVVTTIVGLTIGAAAAGQRDARARLSTLNRDLEQRVHMRTAELQSALDKISLTESRLEEAQQVAHIGSWEWNIPANTLWWSDELGRIFDMDVQAHPITYDRFIEAVHPEDRVRVHGVMRRALENRQPFAFDHRILRADGTVRILQAHGRLKCDVNGRPLRMLGTGQDITDRKQLEAQFQQAQKMEAIGLLAGGVAHDFNNMLTIILGFTDTVLSQIGPDKPISNDLLAIREAGEGAASLTRQLLAFSRKQVFQLVAVDLNVIVTAAEKLLRHSLGDHIRTVTTLAPNLGSIHADNTGLQQVVMNLALNARDAMPSGGTLSIETTHHGVAPGRAVRLTVTDTGHGMGAETQAHIFEPFFTTKVLGRGTGLGLATVHGIVTQLGGAISVESTLGRGTTFHLDFPESGERAAPPVTAERRSGEMVGLETVIIVEDDDHVRAFIRTVLERHGYRALEAATHARALGLADEIPGAIHLLLADMGIPGVNGIELAAQMSAKRPGIAVLLMSGSPNHLVPHGRPPNGYHFLEKPFTTHVLLQKVRAVLGVEALVP
jgi:signal transduction histidine kinase/integral membrane sensor domain MASE1